ncbi:MAG: methionyl-tRNA formyltransferase [bacterium]|nr:methionyl-tRNA formyltransferase [bacterium]
MAGRPKIIFWGTSEFAVPSLQSLVNSGYLISAVITNPDKPIGRKQILTPSPIKITAEEHKIPVYQPTNLKTYNLKPITSSVDLFVVASYGKIIPLEILQRPKYGALNIHPSLLPRWRGPSPIQYTILSGDKETGVTIMKIDEKMDHGPILVGRELETTKHKLQITKIQYRELHDELANLGAKLLIETLPKYLAGKIKPIPQDESKATYSKILTKEDGKITWSKSAEEIERQIRAFDPWPGSWTKIKYKDRELRIVIEEAEVLNENSDNPAGFIWQLGGNLCVQTGKGVLAIKKLKIEGKNSLKSDEFLRGYSAVLNHQL